MATSFARCKRSTISKSTSTTPSSRASSSSSYSRWSLCSPATFGLTARGIPNYGERYRSGEAISSAFVESTVNQVVSKRMVKKQQMRWAPKSAHLLLQVRAKVLNDQLPQVFQRWYPAFVVPTESAVTQELA